LALDSRPRGGRPKTFKQIAHAVIKRDRNVSSQRREFDQAAMERDAEYRSRTEDDLFRIKRADELWHSG
jgi:hypothetical protein